MDQSNHVLDATESKDGPPVGDSLSAIRLREIADVLSLHHRQIGKRLESFFSYAVSCSFLIETDPFEDCIHHWSWWAGDSARHFDIHGILFIKVVGMLVNISPGVSTITRFMWLGYQSFLPFFIGLDATIVALSDDPMSRLSRKQRHMTKGPCSFDISCRCSPHGYWV